MEEWTIANEFAAVAIELDDAGRDRRLRLRDLDSGASVSLDALVLASLARLPEAALRAIVNPESE